MEKRIREIDAEIAKLLKEKEKINADIAAESNLDSDIRKFKSSWSGKRLLEKCSLDTYGTWEVRGEDPNCDFGGHHHEPLLGYLEGTLENVIKAAVKLSGFYTWGGGGSISKVEAKLVTKV